MPVQAKPLTHPWDDLADAFETRDAAARSLDAEALERAEARLEGCKDELACIGQMLLKFALERGGFGLQRNLALLFAQPGIAAFDKAQQLDERLQWALDEIDALKCRIRELEKRVETRAFGIGPGGRAA